MSLSQQTQALIDAALAVRERRRTAGADLEAAQKQEEEAIQIRKVEKTNYDDVTEELIAARAKALAALAAELDQVDEPDELPPGAPLAAPIAVGRHGRPR